MSRARSTKMTTEASTSATVKKKFIVAHDSSIFSFETNDRGAIPKSFRCFYLPDSSDRPIYTLLNLDGDFMAIQPEASDCIIPSTDCMVPSLYHSSKKMKTRFTKDDIRPEDRYEYNLQNFTKGKITRSIRRRSNKSGLRFQRIDIDAKITGNSFLQYSYFQGSIFNEADSIEYVLTQESFLKIAEKYHLYMFRKLDRTGVSIQQPLGAATNSTILSYGDYGLIDCVLKSGPLKSVGDFVNQVHIESEAEGQNNMVRVYKNTSDGVKYETVMERCAGNLYQCKGSLKPYQLKMILRDIIKGMIYLHDNSIVHGRIRPQHILVKKHRSVCKVDGLRGISDVGKLGGTSGCRKVVSTEISTEKDRDVYDMGRTILGMLDSRHVIVDNDTLAAASYPSREPYTNDVQRLYKDDPLAADLIEKCLSCQLSPKKMYDHFWFYKDGEYLEFMQRFSDEHKVSGPLWNNIKASKTKIIDIGRHSKFNSWWLSEIEILKSRGDYVAYQDTSLTNLMELIRNVSHHFGNWQTKKIWRNPIAFEKFVLREFPALFPAMFKAAADCKHPTFQHYMRPTY